jgi:hypothetical protein
MRFAFELSGRRRQDARPRLAKMYRVSSAQAWWPASRLTGSAGRRYRARARNLVPGTGLKLTGSAGTKPNDS